MPIYEYQCNQCGDFTLLRNMVDRDISAICPICKQEGRRVIHSTPHLSAMNQPRLQAQMINEKNQHAPLTLDQYHNKQPISNSHCCQKSRKQAFHKTAGSRPWMLSH